MTGVPATVFSAELLGALIGYGVTDFVVCPGARSQALALTAGALAEAGEVRIHVRIDERAAGFLALGLAVESGIAAPVITTSGSAVANLLPSVVEAHHAQVPMILLTADRPAILRGTGANQTTMQPGMFASFVTWEVDVAPPGSSLTNDSGSSAVSDDAAVLAESARQHSQSGPVHVNLQFVEPLSSALDSSVLDVARQSAERARASVASDVVIGDPEGGSRVTGIDPGGRTVVVAGAGAGPIAEEIAHAGGWPLIAEVTSGARFGPNLIVNYRGLLSDDSFGGRIERAIVVGHPTLSRQVPALLARDTVDVLNISSGEVVRVGAFSTSDSSVGEIEKGWLRGWQKRDRVLSAERSEKISRESPAARAPDVTIARSTTPGDRRRFVSSEVAASRAEVTRELLVDAVWRATWPHDRLIFGASRLIRVADANVGGKKIPVHANRGLSGIDGTIGTALGIALAASPARTRVLLGDLAALHDAGSLLIPQGERRPNVQVIVGNDGGGSLFDLLEVAQNADREVFDRVMYTPQQVDFGALAKAYDWSYVRVTSMGELERALVGGESALELVDVALAR